MLKTREEIIQWLEKYKIRNYEVTDELIVNVNGHVNLYCKYLSEIHVQFGKVTEYFDCSYNNLKSLKGCPKYVGYNFTCWNNDNLKSLKYAPLYIGKKFHCQDRLQNEPEYKIWLLHKKLLDS